MKLESQVASLELSRKLRDLGVVQESAFYWHQADQTSDDAEDYGEKYTLVCEADPYKLLRATPYDRFAAFTVAELGVALPFEVQGSTLDYWKDSDDDWRVYYEANNFKTRISDQSEANARAKMLVYLLEKKIVSVEEVNERLRRAA